MIITGDLADTGKPEEYAALREILPCPVPATWPSATMTDPGALAAKFAGTPYLAGGAAASYAVEYPGLTIIVADSRVAGSPAGRPGDGQLEWIDRIRLPGGADRVPAAPD